MVAAPIGVRWNATHRITSRRVRARACAVPSSVVKRFTMAANASASTSTSTFGTARVFALAVFFVVIARRPRQTCRQLALVVRLTIRLSRYSTIAWVFKLMGLIVYAAVLSPAFVRVAWTYLTDANIERGVAYGTAGRNALDLYFPNDGGARGRRRRKRAIGRSGRDKTQDDDDWSEDERKPVVIFVTGGMWIIGYKAWGALLAQRLARRGVIVASLDYRNFPQGTVGDMIADVGNGIGWVLERLEALGGDKRRVVIVGQSAGAHISATALLRQTEWTSRSQRDGGVAAPCSWSPAAISKFIGISGVYAPDDEALIEHVHRQGLYKNVFWSIMEAGFSGARAAEALPRASPVSILREYDVRQNVRIIPPVMLCHGEADTSAPPEQSKMFARALKNVGIAVDERYYPDKTHTDPFVTDPILGRDILLDDITNCIFGRRLQDTFDEKPLIPRIFVAVARKFVPF